ncbi:MAG TPA: hypothetical protein VG940_04715, partial [Gemmatimonadales bacterium]|nr:hypothetical protein [Gemmatimonadales bacterium]
MEHGVEGAGSAPRKYESDPFIRTLREGIDAQLFAVDGELRYVTFNLAHATHMEAACGVRPSEGTPIL